ncbi:hypothetical protein SAMN07250955_10518 [Arboricoccus pini]|uniref:Uncharacterized protein n=1 Tax=Arboricoccus pini TaxID=1963835 RepID=A0A212R1S5_9PROT|nr:hypothetical protein [Arboricoccus pini]SNB65963.1 hypothetical protein SAMN07250955_10518 [Arboricoccus pini]
MGQIPPIDPAIFAYVRTVISIIVGLSIGRLLTGIARFIQHPKQQKIFGAHLAWTFFMLVYVIHFWWWEFHLGTVHWNFAIYCFSALYAGLIFILCTLLFPDTMYEYTGFADYFVSRRVWFFGILIAIFFLDIGDSRIKGADYLASLGLGLWFRLAFYVLGSAAAMMVQSVKFQTAFAIAALFSEIVWALSEYYTLF